MEASTVTQTIKCCRCSVQKSLTIDKKEWDAWKAGALIQVALRSVSADDRELLISGLCGPCFEEIFAEEEGSDTDEAGGLYEGYSDYDFEGPDYVCTRCNGAGCTKCEE